MVLVLDGKAHSEHVLEELKSVTVNEKHAVAGTYSFGTEPIRPGSYLAKRLARRPTAARQHLDQISK